jgi:hypothetical protein
MPVKEKLVELRLMVGVEDVVGATVDVVGVRSWVSPGIAVERFCMPRPLVNALPPDVEELAAAMPDSVDEGDVDVVGLERAPANESELVVVVVELVVEVVVLGVVPLRVGEPLLWVVVELSTVVVGALSNVDGEDVVVPSSCTEARGRDFLMSLWDLRTGAVSFVGSVLAVLRSDRWAFSW